MPVGSKWQITYGGDDNPAAGGVMRFVALPLTSSSEVAFEIINLFPEDDSSLQGKLNRINYALVSHMKLSFLVVLKLDNTGVLTVKISINDRQTTIKLKLISENK